MQDAVDGPEQSRPGLVVKHYDHAGGWKAGTSQKLLVQAAVRARLEVKRQLFNST